MYSVLDVYKYEDHTLWHSRDRFSWHSTNKYLCECACEFMFVREQLIKPLPCVVLCWFFGFYCADKCQNVEHEPGRRLMMLCLVAVE